MTGGNNMDIVNWIALFAGLHIARRRLVLTLGPSPFLRRRADLTQ